MGVISQGLEMNGLDVHGFAGPQEAIEYFNDPEAPCELVVTDARMPGMSGFELARRIKALRDGVKIIMISAFEINKKEFDKVMPNAKIDGFLTKPFHLSQLVGVLESID